MLSLAGHLHPGKLVCSYETEELFEWLKQSVFVCVFMVCCGI